MPLRPVFPELWKRTGQSFGPDLSPEQLSNVERGPACSQVKGEVPPRGREGGESQWAGRSSLALVLLGFFRRALRHCHCTTLSIHASAPPCASPRVALGGRGAVGSEQLHLDINRAVVELY